MTPRDDLEDMITISVRWASFLGVTCHMHAYCPTGSTTASNQVSVMYPMMRCLRRQQQPLVLSATLPRHRRVLELVSALAGIRHRLSFLHLLDPLKFRRLPGACRIRLGGLIWMLSMRTKAKRKRARKKVRKRKRTMMMKRRRMGRKRQKGQRKKVIDSRGRKSMRSVEQVYCVHQKRTALAATWKKAVAR